MGWTNFHSHTKYCDGSTEHEEYVQYAIRKELIAYGFSSHAPVSFSADWCIQDKDLVVYLDEANRMKEKFRNEIQIYTGLEIDYIPGIAGRNKHLNKNANIDYFIGSIHFVDQFSNGEHWNIDTSKELFMKGLNEIFGGDFRKASERFYALTLQMILEDKPDIIGHLDKIKMYNNQNFLFNEKELWYRKMVNDLLLIIKKNGTIVEINTRGYYRYGQEDLYPSQWIIEQMAQLDIPMMINSDSHKPEEIISGFSYAVKILKSIGVRRLWAFFDNKWKGFEYDTKGLMIL